MHQEADIHLTAGIKNYEELSAKATKLVELLNESKTLIVELQDAISEIDFLSLF